eukprot:TRINITY_DN2697_c0_g1_i3.p1 TRINITY_DN2697_c0_g1~~TRINITY_DN2697_c0_g1_i3.p1  ORF type:complete len:517 (+),score=151.95 TRINITY_DN2697_c0_g1_i3:429-1979(+)
MKCPHSLQAFQISQLDTGHIFPVVQWLVKKVIEVRKETGDLLRMFSESQFKKSYKKLPDDPTYDPSFVCDVATAYLPSRRYRRAKGKPQDEQSQVLSTLLEYGYRGLTGVQREEEVEGEDDSQIRAGRRMFKDEKEKQKEAEARAKAEEDKVAAVMRTMKEAASERVGSSALAGLIGTDADMIREIATTYAAKSEAAGMDEAQIQKFFGAELHRRQVTSRQQQMERDAERLESLKEAYADIEQTHGEVQDVYQKKVGVNRRIEAEIQKLLALETPENAYLLEKLKSLVALNENLKSQEIAFRASCKKELEELHAEIARLKRSVSGEDQDEEDEEKKRVEEAHAEETAKVKKGKQLIAQKVRDIGLLERKIDDVPSRSELQQYQKMFIELFEKIQAKLIETRKYYNSYNTLTDTKKFLENEVSILNSIETNYKDAVASKENKEKLLQSIKGIIASVKSTLEKVETKLVEEKGKKDALNAAYQAAVERERLFYKMTKDFLVECAKNEQLLQQLEADQD